RNLYREKEIGTALQQPEIDFDGGLHGHGLTAFIARTELPLVHRFDGFFVQTQPKASHYVNLARASSRVDDQLKHDGARIFRFAGLFGIFRIALVKHLRRGNAAADAENAATDAAAFARSKSAALARSDSATGAAADAAARSCAVRRRSNLSERIAQRVHVNVR